MDALELHAIGWTIVVTLFVLAGLLLGRSEPVGVGGLLAGVAVAAVGGGAALLVPFAIVRRTRRTIAALVLAAGVLTGAAAVAGVAFESERIHWRWSRAEFDAVVAGNPVDCDDADGCTLGWWTASGTARLDSMVVVWLRDDEWCYAGHGLAQPTVDDPGPDVVRDAAIEARFNSDYVDVRPWYDGWHELCLTT